jgi:hypothetical protein
MNKDGLYLVFLLGVLILVGFGLGIVTHDLLISAFNNYEVRSYQSEPYNISNCANLSLHKTSECLRQKVIPIFNYTVRDDYEKPYDDLVANGGDCYDYTMLYVNMAKILGFNATKAVNVPRHTFAIISDNEGYCILDQTILVGCMRLN